MSTISSVPFPLPKSHAKGVGEMSCWQDSLAHFPIFKGTWASGRLCENNLPGVSPFLSWEGRSEGETDGSLNNRQDSRERFLKKTGRYK